MQSKILKPSFLEAFPLGIAKSRVGDVFVSVSRSSKHCSIKKTPVQTRKPRKTTNKTRIDPFFFFFFRVGANASFVPISVTFARGYRNSSQAFQSFPNLPPFQNSGVETKDSRAFSSG
jgi:hypothetical protein